MGVLREARYTLAQRLIDAGIPGVVTDPRNAVPPCVLVDAPQTIEPINKQGFASAIPIFVCGIPPSNSDPVDEMLDRVEAITAVIVNTVGTVDLTSKDLSGKPCPAYVILHLVTLSRTACL